MPYVNVRITKGVTREQKAQLVREITDTLVRGSFTFLLTARSSPGARLIAGGMHPVTSRH